MEIGLSDDQRLFLDTARRALQDRSPISRVRELIDDPVGYDPEVWAQGAELGWYAMLMPGGARRRQRVGRGARRRHRSSPRSSGG